MTLYEFLNGIRILWNIDAHEYLTCINAEDREYFGEAMLWAKFRDNPHRTFAALPEQDQRRIFEIIERCLSG